MTTDTQTAAPQEAATSIHEPMETVSQQQRTIFRIREEQKADRRAAKMQEKKRIAELALAEQQAYDEDVRLTNKKREQAAHEAYIQTISARCERSRAEYNKLLDTITESMTELDMTCITTNECCTIWCWRGTIIPTGSTQTTACEKSEALRRLHNVRHDRFCKISRIVDNPESIFDFMSTDGDETTCELYVTLDHTNLMQRARAAETVNGYKDKRRELYKGEHKGNAVANILHELGILKIVDSSTNGFEIQLSAGLDRRAFTIDVDLHQFALTIRTNDGGLNVSPEGHGTVGIKRERSPYKY